MDENELSPLAGRPGSLQSTSAAGVAQSVSVGCLSEVVREHVCGVHA